MSLKPSPKLEIVAPPDEPTIITRRVVAAPRELVYDVFSKPEHVRRWMGPRALEMVRCDIDFRVGGAYHFVHRTPDGQEFSFSGLFLELERPSRMVRTFVFDWVPDSGCHETLELSEHDGHTTINTLTVHKTLAARDGHLLHGMEAGMTEGYARLDELLLSLGAS